MNRGCVRRLTAVTLLMLMVAVGQVAAADEASGKGTVADPLGARVAGAAVKLLACATRVKISISFKSMAWLASLQWRNSDTQNLSLVHLPEQSQTPLQVYERTHLSQGARP